MKTVLFAATAIAAIAGSPAHAKGEPSKVAVGVTAGSLGVGPEASVTVGRDVAVRSNVTFLNFSRNFDSDDVTYGGRVKLASVGLMLDYHIGGSGFFLSGGARLNRNKANAFATPTSSTFIGDREYTPAQIGTLNASADFAPIAPVLTTGYSGRLTKGLKFGIEAGAMFMGGARFSPVTASGGGVQQADLSIERDRLKGDVSKYKVFPILQLSLGYHF